MIIFRAIQMRKCSGMTETEKVSLYHFWSLFVRRISYRYIFMRTSSIGINICYLPIILLPFIQGCSYLLPFRIGFNAITNLRWSCTRHYDGQKLSFFNFSHTMTKLIKKVLQYVSLTCIVSPSLRTTLAFWKSWRVHTQVRSRLACTLRAIHLCTLMAYIALRNGK